MGTVSVLAVNDTLTAGVENDIANQINQMHGYITYAGAGETTPGAGTATWVTMGNVTVPAWASKAIVSLTITSITAGAVVGAVGLAVKIGSSTGAVHRTTAAVTGRNPPYAINDQLTSVPTGSQSVTIQATFVSGNVLTATAPCTFDLSINWLA